MRKVRCFPLRWAAVFLAAVFVLGLAGVAMAQTDVTTARLSGTVRDPDGAALPGATISVKSQETGRVMQTVTDSRGFYRMVDLEIGRYDITADLSGFAEAKRSGVRLLLGSALTVDFTLQLARATETVTVTSEVPLVEVASTSASTTIQTEQIQQLPVNGRNFTNLVLAMPETTTQDERGYMAISGERGINTSVVIDGVDDNNPFFGGAMGQAENRAPLQISQESIKEFQVITNGASVELGHSGGGFVNVITKSGTNAFKGSLFYYDQPNSMLANRVDGTSLPNQNKKQYGLAFGGPIMTDKLFFFVSYDQQKQSANYPILATATDPRIAQKYPYFASGTNFDQTQDGKVVFGRLDYQFAGSQRLTARTNYASYTGDNGTSSAPYNATGHNGIERMLLRDTVVSYAGTYGNNWLNDTNLQWAIEDTPRLAKNNQYPEIQVYAGGADFGGVSYLPINPTQVQRKTFGDTVSYLYGDHVFKGGVEYNDTSVNQIFKGNWRGVYIFANQDDFLAGNWNQFRQFGGLNGLTADQAGQVKFGQKELALFVQDTWYISPNLTASLGVRWENLDNPNAPILNPDVINADGSRPLNGHIPDTNNQWSPRIGITWSPGGSGMTVLRLSAGRFWSRTPGLLFSQLYSSNGLRGTQYNISAARVGGVYLDPTDPNCKDSNGKSCYDPLAPGWGANFDPTNLAPINFSNVPNPTGLGVYSIASNFENGHTDRITVGFDQQIAKDTVVNFDATYAKGHNLERLSDLNLQYATNPDGSLQTGANGQPLFTGTSASARPDHYYTNVREYVSDASSEYKAIVMTLRRRFTERFFGFLAVTYSIDKDNSSNERNYSGNTPEDMYNLDGSWGYADRDQRWKIGLNGVWNTPWWGMSLSGTYYYNTGAPFTALTGTDTNHDGFSFDRPTVNGVHFARNSFRQPDSSGINLRIQKSIDLGPGKIGVIVECFNCSNNANRYVPASSDTWGNGQTPGSSFGQVSVTSSVRTFQLALRYDF
jgi:hypothetical protein